MNLFSRLRFHAVRYLMRWGMVGPVVRLLAREIEEVMPRQQTAAKPPRTLLALSPIRFREDLDILANSGQYRVLRFPFDYQALVLVAFYRSEQRRDRNRFYFPRAEDDELKQARERCRRYLRPLMRGILQMFGIDAVISAAIGFRQDFDLGAVANELGVPWIVMHRENFKSAPGHQNDVVSLGRSLGRFSGTKLIVHNEMMREALVQSNFVTEGQTATCGCLRMDPFVKNLKKQNPGPPGGRPSVVFFSFFHAVCLGHRRDLLNSTLKHNWSSDRTEGFVELFEGSHRAFAELAKQRPDVDFTIKTKWGNNWFDQIAAAAQSGGLAIDEIANLKLDADTPAHQLILSADVVVSFGSTTMAEAALAGKPVIVPFFAEVHRSDYTDYILCRDDLHLFDVAKSPEEVKELVQRRLVDPVIETTVMAERVAFFERYVSNCEGNSLDRYLAAMEEVIAKPAGERLPAR